MGIVEGTYNGAANLERAVQKGINQVMYLRTLSSLEDISYDQSNTMVFAIPQDIVREDIMGLSAFAQSHKKTQDAEIN